MKIKNILIGILMVLVFASCGSEFKLAKSFVSQSPEIQVAVYFPESADIVSVVNDEGEYPQVLDSVDQDQFLDIMYAAYAEELGAYQLNVYIPDDPDHVQVDSLHWLVILSKVELQASYVEYIDHLFDFMDEYDYSFTLNNVNVASWFDVNDGEWRPTLYDEFNLRDEFKSWVTEKRRAEAQYHYEITPLKTKDIYDYAVFLGKRYATFTYDYMMNHTIEQIMATERKYPRFKLRWDPHRKEFYFQPEEEAFIEL